MAINPALADLGPLAGRWRMELENAAFLPDPDARVSGLVEIDWIENGSARRPGRAIPSILRLPDAGVIRGRWEISTDQRAGWEHDFNIDSIPER